jgi:hypothetical protein
MFKNFILNLSFVKRAIANANSGNDLAELKKNNALLQQANDELLRERSVIMSKQQSDANPKEEIEKLILKNDNSEKKIASLSAENQKLRSENYELKSSEKGIEHSESVKEIQKRNGVQSHTIHNQLIQIAKLTEMIKNKGKGDWSLMG